MVCFFFFFLSLTYSQKICERRAPGSSIISPFIPRSSGPFGSTYGPLIWLAPDLPVALLSWISHYNYTGTSKTRTFLFLFFVFSILTVFFFGEVEFFFAVRFRMELELLYMYIEQDTQVTRCRDSFAFHLTRVDVGRFVGVEWKKPNYNKSRVFAF
jgi:hypothetical protein